MGEILEKFNKYKLILLFIAYILSIILILKYFSPFKEDQQLDVSGNTLEYVVKDNKLVIFFLIAITGFISLLLYSLHNYLPKHFLSELIKISLTLFVFFGLVFVSLYLFLYTPWPLTILVDILNIGIIIGLLALGYNFMKDHISKFWSNIKKPSITRLIVFYIFYIPCQFINLINYLKNQFKATTSTVWIILLIDIIIIGLRIIVPILYKKYKKFTSPSGYIIKEGPIYLNNLTDLGVFQQHTEQPEKLLAKKSIFNYNYALSSWIWINPQPPSTSNAYNKSTSILNYGDVLKINYNKNKIEILAATTKENIQTEQLVKIYEMTHIPFQKWNNFILNYNGGTLDIFINNVLVSSSINITPVMYYNKATAGAINGINGGIKNIVYYDRVLSKRDINSIYNQ